VVALGRPLELMVLCWQPTDGNEVLDPHLQQTVAAVGIMQERPGPLVGAVRRGQVAAETKARVRSACWRASHMRATKLSPGSKSHACTIS
jgi:hypothetical protein